MKKISGKIVLLLLVLQLAHKEAGANNNDPVTTKPLVSSVKLIRPTPIKFNRLGKQLEYKRKLAFEGKDSAEAFVKLNQLVDDYLPLTGGVLTGGLTTPSLSVTNGFINGMAVGTNGTSVEITSGNLNNITASGFYKGESVSNAPDAGWWYILVEGHDNNSGGWTKQTATAYGAANAVAAGTTYIRNQTNGTWTAWRAIAMQDWALGAFINTQGNVEQNINGIKHFHSDKGNGVYLGSSSNPSLQAFSTDGGAAFMTFHRENQFAVNVGLDPDNVFRIGGWSAPANTLQLDMSGNLTVAGNINAAYKIGAAGTYTNGSFNATIAAGGGGQRSRVLSLLDRGYIDAVLESGGQASFVFGSGYSGVDAMYINTHNGNVGIGTTSPIGKLQVMGKLNEWDGPTRMYLTNNASLYGRTNLIMTGRLDAYNDSWAFGSNARNSIVFATNSAGAIGSEGTEKYSIQLEGNSKSLGFLSSDRATNPTMVLTQDGSVGIGTVNPQALLAVNGTILGKKVKVSVASADWPDYVFASNYILKPLCEVESFIKKNNHLPDVPSAAKMEKNGADLGDNQALLLKKIEELTLYAIEQDKKLKQQEQANKQQLERLKLLEEKLNKLLADKK